MFIAREKELKKLKSLLKRKKSSFLAIYGRRRVGKTEIVRHFCEQNGIQKVEFAGRVDQNKKQQIKAFVSKLKKIYGVSSQERVVDWNDAFYLLMDYLDRFDKKEKVVVFIDELPWIDTAKLGFLGELADFWNSFCSQRSNIILIVCGSSASYMMKKLIHNRGALHGRLTDIMPMAGFAFENICLMHSEHIKKILGISGVETQSHYWNYVSNNKSKRGVQIDIMLEHTNGSRNIDIIECKYHNQEFVITKSYKEELVRKIEVFNEQTKYRHNIRLIFISSFGVVKNEYYNEIVSLDICLGDIIGVGLV